MAAAQHRLAAAAERVSAVFGPERASVGVRSEAFRDAVPDRDIDELLNRLERQSGPYRGTRVKKGVIWLEFARGSVPVYARLGADGLLTGMVLGRAARPPRWWERRVANWGRMLAGVAVPPALLLVTAVGAWTVPDDATWTVYMATALALWASCRQGPRLVLTRRARMATDGLMAACALSFSRLPGLAMGRFGTTNLTLALLWLGVAAALWSGRRPLSGPRIVTPAHWPLGAGTWAIFSGGTRSPNHHYRSPEQRFALDIVGLRRSGARAEGLLPRKLGAYACYGAVVRSPVRGTVARVADGEPDQVPGEVRPCLPTGNCVVIDTGPELVYLCHLQQGSIRVSPGDQVGPGDELGLVGNSGRSTEPHLHIHAQAKNEPRGRLLEFEGVASQPLTRDTVVVRP
jgi:hypothetical protein